MYSFSFFLSISGFEENVQFALDEKEMEETEVRVDEDET